MNDELMTSSQAAELAGTTRQTILFWLRTGHLTATHILGGGQRRPHTYLFARQAVLTACETRVRPGWSRSAKVADIAETPATDAHPQPEGTNEP
jgi:excisionase family DNA binding protein